MAFLLSSISSIWTAGTVETITMIIKIILSAVTLLAALGIGFLLRRLLVRHLGKTVLDKWVGETLGILVFIVPFLLGVFATLAIWNANLLSQTRHDLNLNPQTVTTFAWNLFQTLLFIALGIGIARTIKNLTIRGLGENRIDINIRTLIGRIFYFITLIFVAFLLLTIWNVPFTVPVAVIGAITIAVTVAIQDVLKDLVAGFYILVERPFYIGNQISITTAPVVYVGKVEDVQLRATKLRLISGEEITVPNMLVFSSAVINNTFYGERRATLAVTLSEELFSQENTPRQIIEALQAIEMVMVKPEPAVLCSGYTEKKITLSVHFWVASSQAIDISGILYALHTLLPEADVAVREPYGGVF